MRKRKGYIYGYDVNLCRKMIDDFGNYRHWLGFPLGYGLNIYNDGGMDYEFARIKELGKAKPLRKAFFSKYPYYT